MKENSIYYMLVLMLVVCLIAGITSCVTSKKKAAMAQNMPLTETKWVLTHVKGESIPKSFITPYIVFGKDGVYTGNLGCNTFFGNYTYRKDRIKMEYEGATKRLCQKMKVEKLFMQGLHADFKKYEIRKDTLFLKDANGEVLRFIGRTDLTPQTSEPPTE
jgi:heat shock protein HslJ